MNATFTETNAKQRRRIMICVDSKLDSTLCGCLTCRLNREPPLSPETECDNCGGETPVNETHTCEQCGATLCDQCICEECA